MMIAAVSFGFVAWERSRESWFKHISDICELGVSAGTPSWCQYGYGSTKTPG